MSAVSPASRPKSAIYMCSSSSLPPYSLINRREKRPSSPTDEPAAAPQSSKQSPAMANWLQRKLAGCQWGHTVAPHTHTHTLAACCLHPPLLPTCHIRQDKQKIKWLPYWVKLELHWGATLFGPTGALLNLNLLFHTMIHYQQKA